MLQATKLPLLVRPFNAIIYDQLLSEAELHNVTTFLERGCYCSPLGHVPPSYSIPRTVSATACVSALFFNLLARFLNDDFS